MVQMVTPGVRYDPETLVNFGSVDVNPDGQLASPLHEAKTNRDLRPGIYFGQRMGLLAPPWSPLPLPAPC